MTFDIKAYRDAVLKPNSRGEGLEQLREVLVELQRDPSSTAYVRLDLSTLYAIPTPVRADELVEWEKKIVPALNKAAALPSAKLLKDLLGILQERGETITDPAFWGRAQAKRQTAMVDKLGEGIRQLRAEYPLGVVSREALTARLATIGITGVTDASITTIAEQEGLGVFDDPPLPEARVPAAVRPIWEQVKKHPEYRTIFDVLLVHRSEDIRDVRVLDAFTAGAPITPGDIEMARHKSEEGQDTDALQDAQKFLGALRDHCTDAAALQSVVLATLVDVITTQLHRGKPLLAVRSDLVAAGLDTTDASRMLAALAAARGASLPGVGLDTVRELIRQGQLADAERTLASLPRAEGDDAELSAVSTQLDQLKAQKQHALDAYHRALADRDFAAAGSAVSDALVIDPADESLGRMRDALPPAPPRGVTARADGDGVVVSWASDADDGLSITVVRAEGRIPTTPADGVVVATGLRGATTVRDSQAVGGQLVGYAVFASRDGKASSDPGTVELTVLPPPADVTAAIDLTAVRLGWTAPRAAAGVVVTRLDPDGRSTEVEVTSESTLSVGGLTTGRAYLFTARAIYLGPGGRQLSDAVSLTAVPRGVASPVVDLRLTPTPDPAATIALSWTPADGFEVELWAFARTAVLEVGQMLSPSEVSQRQGSRVTPLPGGRRGEVQLAGIEGLVKLAPLTVTDGGYLCGAPVLVGSPPTATRVVVETFGDELRISWEWPPGDEVIELAWTQSGRPRTRRVTRARYRAEGGAKVSDAAAVSDLTIATVIRIDDDEWVAAPHPVPLGTLESREATYSVRLKKALFGGKATAAIEGRTSDPGFTLPVAVVVKQGSIMPFGVGDGHRVAHLDFDFESGVTSSHQIDLGPQKSPFWVCVFPLDEDARLDPPPTSQMKG